MQIYSDIKNIRIISDQILDFINRKKKKVDKQILFDIKLCVEEAVRNAIIHGNKSDKSLLVNITYTIEDDRFKVTIEDKGRGFNVANLPDPTDIKNLYKESGRGVYIMKRLMDRTSYNEKGNCVTLEKILEA